MQRAFVVPLSPGAAEPPGWVRVGSPGAHPCASFRRASVFLAQGTVVTERFEAGDVGYAPMGAGHDIKNTGPGPLKVLVGFNSPHYRSNELSAWLASNPVDILATNLGVPAELAGRLPKESHVFIPASAPGS